MQKNDFYNSKWCHYFPHHFYAKNINEKSRNRFEKPFKPSTYRKKSQTIGPNTVYIDNHLLNRHSLTYILLIISKKIIPRISNFYFAMNLIKEFNGNPRKMCMLSLARN